MQQLKSATASFARHIWCTRCRVWIVVTANVSSGFAARIL